MAITIETRTEIIELIVGMVGAAPGATYLSEFADIVDSGVSLRDLAIAIADNPAYKALYPSFLTAEEFATSFITQLLGDEVSAATLQTAIDAMIADLNSGSHRGAAIYTAITALSGMSDTDANFGDAVAAFNNKTEVANHYSVVTQQSSDSVDELMGVISGVDSSTASVVTAKAAIDVLASQGESYTLAATLDSINGTSDNDTFLAVASNVAGDRTLTVGDTIDGRAGTDTLRIVSTEGNTALTIPSETIRNIENLVVVSDKGALTSLNAGGFGFDSVSLDASAQALTISGISTATTVSIGSITAAPAAGDAGGVRTITYSDAAGLGDSATINIGTATTGRDASASGVTPVVTAIPHTALSVLGMETLNLNFTGNVALTGVNLFTNTQTLNISSSASARAATTVNLSGAMGDGSTVNISGAGVVDLGSLNASIATVNASTSTGGVKVTLDAKTAAVAGGSGADAITLLARSTAATAAGVAVGVTVNTGAGDDTLDISALLEKANVGVGAPDLAKYTFIGGTGTDTLLVNAAAAVSGTPGAGTRAIINKAATTGFETLRFKDAVTAFDAGQFTGLSSFVFAKATTGDSIYSVKNGDELTFLDGSDHIVTLNAVAALDFGSDVLNLSLVTKTAGATYAEFDTTDYVAINIGSWDNSPASVRNPKNTITKLTVTDRSRITIEGNAALELETAEGGRLTIDGTAATGKLTITTINTTGNNLISGGSADDSLTGGGGNDLIRGFAGKDTLHGGSGGVDRLEGGAGADTFVITAATSVASDIAAAHDSILDYTGADILKFTAADTVAIATSGSAVAGTTVSISAGGKVSFASADTTFAEKVAALQADDANVGKDNVVFFEDSGNTYVYGGGTSDADETDFMVQLTGVTGLTTMTEGLVDNVGNFTVV